MKGILFVILIGLVIFAYWKSPTFQEKVEGIRDVFSGEYNANLVYVGRPVREMEVECDSKMDCVNVSGCEDRCICYEGDCYLRKES